MNAFLLSEQLGCLGRCSNELHEVLCDLNQNLLEDEAKKINDIKWILNKKYNEIKAILERTNL